MRQSTKILSILAATLAFGLLILHTIGVGVQTWNIVVGEWELAVDWSQFGALKASIVALRAASVLALLTMLVVFVRNVRRGGRGIFVRANIKLLWWAILPSVAYSWCNTNMHILSGVRNWAISTGDVLVVLALVCVALVYRRGVEMAEDGELTI